MDMDRDPIGDVTRDTENTETTDGDQPREPPEGRMPPRAWSRYR
jgi:hypothetical protein